jgi:hypothetical protein
VDLNLSKRVERNRSGVKYWVFDCSNKCGSEIKIFKHTEQSASGLCKNCSAKSRRKHIYKIDESQIIRIETVETKYQSNKVWILQCSGCSSEIRVWPGQRSVATGRCSSCVSKGEPYQHILTSIKHAALSRNLEFTLTIEDVAEFAKTKACSYCERSIVWNEYWSKINSTHCYYLDRKDLSLGYTKSNCIVCCTFCNFLRGNKLSHEEFKMLSPGLKAIRLSRGE